MAALVGQVPINRGSKYWNPNPPRSIQNTPCCPKAMFKRISFAISAPSVFHIVYFPQFNPRKIVAYA